MIARQQIAAVARSLSERCDQDELLYVRPGRPDDCFPSAIARVLQVPINDVPDFRIDERLAAGEAPGEISLSIWAELDTWAAGRGLRVLFHRKLPPRRRRWIGIVRHAGAFNDHCIVMAYDKPDHDERAYAVWERAGIRVRRTRPDDIAYGLSFARRPDASSNRR